MVEGMEIEGVIVQGTILAPVSDLLLNLSLVAVINSYHEKCPAVDLIFAFPGANTIFSSSR
jgi:hypothetical protein